MKKISTPQKNENVDTNSRHVSAAKKMKQPDLDQLSINQSQNHLNLNQESSKQNLKNQKLSENV